MSNGTTVGGRIPSSLTQAGGYNPSINRSRDLWNQAMSYQIQQQQNNWRNKSLSDIGIGGNKYNGMEYGLLSDTGNLGWGQSENMAPGSVVGGVVDGIGYGNTPGLDSGNGIGGMTLGGVADIGMGLLNAYNVFNTIGLQNDYMDMAKEQLGMAREQWNMTKDEVSRIARVRNNLNSGYATGNYKPSPESKTYA